ncbi:MAG: hypothetical protein RJQ09_16925 [Cyclobacteriaceae bacterium]
MKWIKRVAALVIGLALTIFALISFLSEALPEGVEGPEAEALADKMLASVNANAWNETGAISWNFDDRQQHIWDKKRHLAQVTWGDNIVQIDINNRTGVVIKGEDKDATFCKKAWRYWANDSFWLNPVVKIHDTGTSRKLVSVDGEVGLLVTYSAGGVTPGDSYLWLVDDNGLPYKWKMWVSIIPIGGISTTWENWIETSTGALISTKHSNFLTLNILDVQAAVNIDSLTGNDIFKPLIEGSFEKFKF